MKPEDEPERILIVKLSAIGDVVQTLPMAEALRARFPRAHISWLVEEAAADLLQDHPAIDRVIVSRRQSWLRGIFQPGRFRSTAGEIRRFLRHLRGSHYDWIIDNHGILKSGLLVFLARGRRKIGFRASAGIAEEGNYLFTNERYGALPIERHALERYLDLVAHLGVPAEKAALRYAVPEEARRVAERLLRENGVMGRPLIIIHPLAKWESKQWPGEYFTRLADRLGEEGTRVVFSGSPDDRGPVEEIFRQSRHPDRMANLCGRTRLRELAGLFSLADLVITPDTGPMHLAAAVGAPLIALFGPTAPWRTGPYGNGHVILRRPLACSPCFRRKCPTRECMNSLTVEEVFEAAQRRLEEKSQAIGE
ncbi:MAG: lipopolysaccharide heptosyltransferase II [Deltaproteobacteria bacterium]|nr:lipopolysaccharide heptosyltransferase II [Deltaproteobacteria bacterium]